MTPQFRGLNEPALLKTYPDQVIGAATLTALLPSNPNRLGAYIANVGGAAARIGDESVAAAQGYPLPATTGSVELDTTDAIFVYSASGTTIAICEVVRP